MNLALTEEQDAVRGLARQIFDGRLTADRLKEIAATEDAFDRALWEELARANLLGIAVSEEFGGSGHGIIELCLLLEEVGRAVAPVPAFEALVLGALPLSQFGTPEQKTRYLPGVVEGKIILTGALPEDESSVTARRDGAAWVLDGLAFGVPAVHLASAIVVVASNALFLVDVASVSTARNVVTSHELRFDVSFGGVSAELLGEATAIAWLRERGLLGLCAMQTGVAEKALRLTAEYTSSREQFGRPLGSFQAVQQRVADCYIDVEAMRWTMWQAAWRVSEGFEATEEVLIAKFWASEAGQRVLSAAMHLHGGIGVDVSYPLHRYTLWAKQIELTLGGAAAQLEKLGDVMATCD
ncbi:MAG: acyl-CoA dehydrogenase family protein [Actinomycetota bacterium]|nr:acyl-CoA/acyl-ACP dehydrogenase [Actinomycetota bacterium]